MIKFHGRPAGAAERGEEKGENSLRQGETSGACAGLAGL